MDARPAECPLCMQVDPGQSAERLARREDVEDGYRYECPRCGTFYAYDRVMDDHSNGLPFEVGIRLSNLAREITDRREVERPRPEILRIEENNIRDLAAMVVLPRGFASYVDRTVETIARRSTYPGSQARPITRPALAALLCVPHRNLHDLLEQVIDEGYLVDADRSAHTLAFKLTVKGWQHAESLDRGTRGDRVFVAMSFDKDMKPAFDKGIRPALEACGYKPPFRVDDPEHDNDRDSKDFRSRIDDRILAEIRRARFVVVDATINSASVYFEAGFAEGLGIPTIWCCHKGTVEGTNGQKLAFDTRQIGHIVWDTHDNLCAQLKAKIGRHGWVRTRN